MPQFPHRDALHHKTEGDDQRCGLHRREDVEPNAGGNQSECKPCHPCDKRGGKRRRQINGNAEDRCVHRACPPLVRVAARAWTSSPAFDVPASICYASVTTVASLKAIARLTLGAVV